MSNVSNYAPNINELQNATQPDKSKCLQASDLNKQLNVAKFNKMMNDTANKVNSFVTSYIKQQSVVKDKKRNDNSLEFNRYRQTALDIRRKMVEKHEHIIKELNKDFNVLTTQIQGLEHTEDLNKMLKKQNLALKKEVENQVHTIEISDRKAYYENEQNGTASWWSHHFQTKYKYLILLLILGIVITNRYKEFKLWGIIIALALYPLIAFFVLDIIEKIWIWIRANSRLVYLHSDM
jgi:hypothetical protein